MEVLRPQDCLLHSPSGSFLPVPISASYGHYRLYHHQPAGSAPRPSRKHSNPSRPEAARKRREISPNQPAKSGQPTILKRVHSLDSVTKAKKKETTVIMSSSAGRLLEPAVFGTGKQIQMRPAAAGTEFAGSTFDSMSPSPRKLPLPSFSRSCSATKDLRRLLRID